MVTKTGMMDSQTRGPAILSYLDSTPHSDDLASWTPDWTKGGPVHQPLVLMSSFIGLYATSEMWSFGENDVSESGF